MEGNQDGYPDYAMELQKCKEFLAEFQSLGDDARKYADMMQSIVNREQSVMEIEVDDILSFRNESELGDNMVANTGRYIKMFSQAVDESLPEPTANIEHAMDVWDVLRRQREIQRREAEELPDADLESSPENGFPAALMRRQGRHFPFGEEVLFT